MRRSKTRVSVTLSVLCCTAFSPSMAGAGDERAALDFFESKIRPVLVEHCYKCHAADAKRVKGGLLLDTRDGLLRGGDNGAAIVPGKPGESLLLRALRHEDDDLAMPPKQMLPARVIADFERWIEAGAVDPRVSEKKGEGEPVDGRKAAASFWAFQAPRPQDAPSVRRVDWARSSIDAFVLAKLEEHGLTPSGSATKRAWLRRVSFDLSGLPPTPEELEAYLEDDSEDADVRVVERLLSSVRTSERWARLWLDVSRYAEDQAHIVGNNKALFYPNAYLYRDWVIEAFATDTPYDEFLRLQLASDLVGESGKGHEAALGFLGLGPKYYRRNDPSVMADEWEDRVDTVTRGLLGLTVACARCHDHKFDPIPTEDYYALAGVFASTDMFNRPVEKAESVPETVPNTVPNTVGAKTGAKTGKKTKKKAKKPKKSGPGASLHVVREGKARDLPVYIRGNVQQKGAVVPRRFLTALSKGEPKSLRTGSGRRELAEAIVDPENPLTDRVFVNRVWAEIFGRGLVDTPSNFGRLGSRPTHPELLDDLAVRFAVNGRSVKWLLRELTLSSTYRQSSSIRADAHERDPENRFLWRVSRRRLSIEAWRDSLLRAAGILERKIGGRSIEPEKPEERRRTVYSRISRFQLNRMLTLFDFPDPNAHAAGRSETTTPLQKLFVMNSEFIVRRASDLAVRVTRELPGDADSAKRVERLYELLFARRPLASELELGTTFVRCGGPNAWVDYTQALIMSNESLFVD